MSFKEVYNSQRLIAEIKRRPALYDPSLRQYFDKDKKSKLWQEVCEAVVENWKSLDKGERIIKGRDVQKRWKSLRDCFNRELLLQEKMRMKGMNITKKRKYLYFDNLSFLLPSMRTSLRDISITMPVSSDDCITDEDNKDENQESEATTFNTIVQKKRKHLEDNLVYIIDKNNGHEVIDDDKAFLVSLLPTIRTFNDEQKFRVRMLLMDIVRQVQLGQNPQLVTYQNKEPQHFVNSALSSSSSLLISASRNTNSIKIENVDFEHGECVEVKEELIEEADENI